MPFHDSRYSNRRTVSRILTERMGLNKTHPYILETEPQYQLIPLIWAPVSITITSSLLINHYLTSKPLHSKTVMDFVNRVFFAHFSVYSIFLAACSTTNILFRDCGQIVAVVTSCALIQQFQNLAFLLLGNIGQALFLNNIESSCTSTHGPCRM